MPEKIGCDKQSHLPLHQAHIKVASRVFAEASPPWSGIRPCPRDSNCITSPWKEPRSGFAQAAPRLWVQFTGL